MAYTKNVKVYSPILDITVGPGLISVSKQFARSWLSNKPTSPAVNFPAASLSFGQYEIILLVT